MNCDAVGWSQIGACGSAAGWVRSWCCSANETSVPLDLSAGVPLNSAYIPSVQPAPLCAPLCSPAPRLLPGNSLTARLKGIYRNARHPHPLPTDKLLQKVYIAQTPEYRKKKAIIWPSIFSFTAVNPSTSKTLNKWYFSVCLCKGTTAAISSYSIIILHTSSFIQCVQITSKIPISTPALHTRETNDWFGRQKALEINLREIRAASVYILLFWLLTARL